MRIPSLVLAAVLLVASACGGAAAAPASPPPPPDTSIKIKTASTGVSLSGKLSTILGADGRQVEYNGHPLYTYSKDTAPGQANGQGVAGRWGVATADMAVVGPAPSPAPSAAAPSPSPTK